MGHKGIRVKWASGRTVRPAESIVVSIVEELFGLQKCREFFGISFSLSSYYLLSTKLIFP